MGAHAVPTVFFAANRDEFAELAAGLDLMSSFAGPEGAGRIEALAGLDTVAAADLDPAQLIDLDVLATGSDPADARESVLTPAHELSPDDGSGETVLLPVRAALGARLAHLSEQEVDALAEGWAETSGGGDSGWSAYRCGQLIRSLSLLALLARADSRDLYVRFEV